jgi:uncharacterized protein with HEPN domain
MDARDRQALIDVMSVLDRALGYPIDSEETFLAKDYLQDAVIRCLEIVGEATKRLSPELRLLHPGVPWSLSALSGDPSPCRCDPETGLSPPP